jgi:hypothetical protein
VWGVCRRSFHGSSNDTIWPEILPFLFEVVFAVSRASGASDYGVEVSMDAPFHGGSNDDRVGPRRPEIVLSSHGGVLVLVMRFAVF